MAPDMIFISGEENRGKNQAAWIESIESEK